MSAQEQRAFLAETKCIAKISTLDNDGSIHTVPVWYVYDGRDFTITSDETSHHVKNIRRNNKLTLLIDTVQFPTRGVQIKGRARLKEDDNNGNVHKLELGITNKYITDERKAAEYVKKREARAKRVAIVVSPERMSNWDFSKSSEEKQFFKDSPIYSLNKE